MFISTTGKFLNIGHLYQWSCQCHSIQMFSATEKNHKTPRTPFALQTGGCSWSCLPACGSKVAPEWQPLDHWHLSNTLAMAWMLPSLGKERGSCERTDKLERTSIIDWLEESCGCWSEFLIVSGGNRWRLYNVVDLLIQLLPFNTT